MKHRIVTPNLEFDPDIYFAIVADNLISNFGQSALPLADLALVQMHDAGDDDGYGLWKGVHDQLCRKIRDAAVPPGTTLH